jgi:hypothetical protein
VSDGTVPWLRDVCVGTVVVRGVVDAVRVVCDAMKCTTVLVNSVNSVPIETPVTVRGIFIQRVYSRS